MGNVCCTGRSHQSTNNTKLVSELQTSSASNPSKPKNPAKKASKDFSKKLTSGQVLELENLKFFNKNNEKLSEKSSDSVEENSLEKLNTVNVFSNRSETVFGLNYNLIMPEELTKAQQNQILSVLDNYKNFLKENDQEVVDGFVYVFQDDQKMIMMITTHAFYLLSIDNFMNVIKRTTLEDIILIVLSKNKEILLFVLKTLKDFCLTCEYTTDLVKALQQVTFEAFNQYIPWITKETDEEVRKLQNNLKIEDKAILSDENLAITKAIIENGEIGETRLVLESCMNSGASKMMNIYFLLTDLAVYTLDSSYSFLTRFLLRNIEKIEISYKDENVLIHEIENIHEFSLPVSLTEKIKEAAWKLGNKSLVIEFV